MNSYEKAGQDQHLYELKIKYSDAWYCRDAYSPEVHMAVYNNGSCMCV